MALSLKPLPTGGYFKPESVRNVAAALVEVTDFQAQRGTKNGPKDTAIANVTVFKTKEDLSAGKGEVQTGVMIEQVALARDCNTVGVGGAFVATIGQVPTDKGNPCWIWKEVTDQTLVAGVVAYADGREARLAEAKASAPSFD